MSAVARLVGRGAQSFARVYALLRELPDMSSPEGRGRERQRRASLSAVMAMTAKVVSVATALVTVPLTLHYLGPERYGMWMILSSLVAMLSFADLGIGNGILSAVAAAYGRNDREAIRSAISSGFTALGFVMLAIVTAFWLVYPYVAWHRFFNVATPLARGEAGPAIAVFVMLFALSIPASVVQRVQFGMQRGFMASAWLCGGSLLTLPAIVAATLMKGSLSVLVAVFLGVPLLANILNSLVFFATQHPDLRPLPRYVKKAAMAAATGDGLLFMLVQLGNSVTAGCASLIIATVAGAAHVAQYAVPERILALVVMLVAIYMQPLWPAYREALVRGDVGWVLRTYRRTLVQTLIFALALLGLLAFAMPWLLRVWVGPSVQPEALLIAGLCAFKLAECLLWVNAILLNALDVLYHQVWWAIATAGGYIALATILAQAGGVSAIAWAGAFVIGVATLVPSSFVIRRRLAAAEGGVAR